MSAFQAAVGAAQLARLDDGVRARRSNAERLTELFSALDGVRLQAVPRRRSVGALVSSLRASHPARRARSRDELASGLVHERVDCKLPYARPLAEHEVLGGGAAPFPVARAICDESLGFRVDPALGRAEMDAVGLAVGRLWTCAR